MDNKTAYDQLMFDINSIAYQLQHSEKFKERFANNPAQVLDEMGITDMDRRSMIMQQVNSPIFIQQESVQKTNKLAERFKESIKNSLEQIESGYRGSMWMYWIAFLTGILLIITAIVFAIAKDKNLLSIVFGSLGTLDLLVFFIMKPPLELQNSRIGFARLEAAFMNWFIDIMNINSVLLLMNSAYKVKINPQTFTPEIDKENFEILLNKVIQLSDQSVKNTKETIHMMGTIIRQTAGDDPPFKGKPKQDIKE